MFYPSLVWKIDTSKKEMFITFDDGPSPGITEKVLDTLEEYNARATFFLIGDKAVRYPDMVEEIRRRGHQTGNHTYHHLKGWNAGDDAYLDDISHTQKLTGSNLFRPPYGKISRSQIKILKNRYHIIMWTVLSADFDVSISPEKCAENVTANAGQGSIVVFHDSEKASKRMLHALPETLHHFSEQGYTFKAIHL